MSIEANEVVITGLGPVTSIGTGCDDLWGALTTGRTHLTSRVLPVDIGMTVELTIASMPATSEVPGLLPHAQTLAAQGMETYRDLAYSLLAGELAFADAGLDIKSDGRRVGMIQAFEAPGVEATVGDLFGMFSGGPPTDGPPKVYEALAPRFYNMQPFLYVHVIAKALGLHGFCTNVHNACSSGAYAIELAADRIRNGHADVMLVVGGEAYETAARLQWFRKLDLYVQSDCMAPFDGKAKGFYVGEGAGAILLESATHAEQRGAASYARYVGGAFAHQGWKQTIPDIRAARLADVIREALKVGDVEAEALDLVVPHGAGTSLSDGYERACLQQALGDGATGAVMTAFKPNVGHMLAASGVVDTICALLAMKHGQVPATLNTGADCMDLPVPLVTSLKEHRVDTLLKLSTGFTGHDAASLYRRV